MTNSVWCQGGDTSQCVQQTVCDNMGHQYQSMCDLEDAQKLNHDLKKVECKGAEVK